MAIKISGTTIVDNSRNIINYGTTITALGSVTGATTINLSNGNYFTANTTGSTTWTFSGQLSTSFNGFVLKLTNGGSATQTWPTGIKWPGGTAPTLTTAGTDVLVFITDDNGATWRGIASMLDSK